MESLVVEADKFLKFLIKLFKGKILKLVFLTEPGLKKTGTTSLFFPATLHFLEDELKVLN
ncbi:hypothetical protein DRI96_02790 [Candidatus Aerophobetes bacterium]|uniref:Uncharacterized protein n=1 Tax=Aerophobetes bacterium TaxID=2030807 RepID=A0A662DI20_UNCAE|nr:MAG: hypothetical protein DRI96_02790 [Candidatus Aerophobetes bacterium]